jgi:hypothetical protein
MLDFLKTADSPSVAILHERLLREVCEIIDNVDQAAGRWDFDGRELSTYRQFEQKMKKHSTFLITTEETGPPSLIVFWI